MAKEKKLRIAFVGQPEYFRIHYKDMLKSDEFDCTEIPIKICTPETYSPLLYQEFDYIFFFRGEFCPESVLKNVKGKKIIISSEPFPKCSTNGVISTNELYERFTIFRKVKDMEFDYIFHYDKTSVNWLITEGVKVNGTFEMPISSTDYGRFELAEKDWDVCFFGRSNEHRENILGNLKRDFNVIHITHGVDEDLMCAIIDRCKIVLNLNTEGVVSYNPRLAQSLAAESFVISEHMTHHDTFTAGVDFVECKWYDIYDTVKEMLKPENDSYRHEIASSGLRKVEEKLDCVKCWKDLIERIDNDL